MVRHFLYYALTETHTYNFACLFSCFIYLDRRFQWHFLLNGSAGRVADNDRPLLRVSYSAPAELDAHVPQFMPTIFTGSPNGPGG